MDNKVKKKNMIRIAPSILSADFSRLKDELIKIEEAGGDLIHVDVMDGHFVPNITIGPLVVSAIKKSTSLPLDVHLMIENPDFYIPRFVDAGADIITVHVEACSHLHKVVQSINNLKIKSCVALNPATSVLVIEDIIEYIDMVLFMSVNPGFGGQKFITSVLGKIKQMKNLLKVKNINIDIEVDGGVKIENAKEVKEAGANILVAGTAVFHSENYKNIISKLREI